MGRAQSDAPPDSPHRWRDLPVTAAGGIAAVEALAVVAVVAAGVVLPGPPVPSAAGTAGLLAVLALVHTELATGIERARRRTTGTSYFDLSSVWTFAAALVLPVPLAAAVILVAYAHLWVRVWRPAAVPAHRHVYTTATVLLAAAAAHVTVAVLGGLPTGPGDVGGVLVVVGAAGVYILANTLLVALAIGLTHPGADRRDLWGRADDNVLELATLCLGGLVAVTLGNAPWLVLFALPPILVLHRAVLVRQLEDLACTDAKTGLLTAAAWRREAGHRLADAPGGAGGVLILDLDHFKSVNDEHGHLAGDEVLAAVAATLRGRVGEHGIVGRFGGEEFVVLLPGRVGAQALPAVAERLRQAVAGLAVPVLTAEGATTVAGLTVSVGAARVPVDGATVDEVLQAADACLYAAKRGGRNRVRIAVPAWIPSPRRPSGLGRARLP